MDELAIAFASHDGYLRRADLNSIGISDAWIRRLLREGCIVRIRHGTYAWRAHWTTLDHRGRHLLRARSVLEHLGPGCVASHHTAAVLHGLDTFGVSLDAIHLTRLDGRTVRSEAGVVFHRGTIDVDHEVHEIDGRLVTAPWRAVHESAGISSVESGMVVASSALRTGLTTVEELRDTAHRFAHWPGRQRADLAMRMSDARLATVGEVRSLHMMWRHHIPHPELQWRVLDDNGLLLGITDFGWATFRHTGEFDGLFKYGRLNPDPKDPGRTLTDEKTREDAIRGRELGMSRWIWTDLELKTQSRTAARIAADLERSRSLYTRNRTHLALSPDT